MRVRVALAGGPMQGHALAYGVVVADLEAALHAPEGQVLRRPAEHRVLVDPVAAAHTRVAFDHGMGRDPAVGTDLDVGFDDGVRADLDALGETRAGIDDGARVDAGPNPIGSKRAHGIDGTGKRAI